MQNRRHLHVARGELTPDLRAVLAAGWSAPMPPGSESDFSAFDYTDRGLYEVYQRHRRAVDTEAARQGRDEAWIIGRRRQLEAWGQW